MGLDDTLASRQEIEKLVAGKVCKVCQDWGLTVLGVDLLEIDPTPTIQVCRDDIDDVDD
jgi:regulator of protease activity HflC (stomatin/prohibitin superfamily)